MLLDDPNTVLLEETIGIGGVVVVVVVLELILKVETADSRGAPVKG